MPKDQKVKPAKSAPKTTAETTIPTGTLKPQAHGGALRHGGTNKGGTGRPPDKLKETWLRMLSDKRVFAAQREVIRNPDHPQFTAHWSKLVIMARGIPGRAPDAPPEDGPSAVIIDL